MFPEIVAEMADFLLRLENVETALCMGHYAKEMIISIRTARHDLNAGDIIKRLVLGLGTAGGHGMMAGGKIENVSPDRKSIRRMEKILIERIIAEFDMAKVESHKIAE
jgi:nanoRNase/pAp phosphatase (c-di-AMP/oligoRNAs hydrolase)